jgi:hypothetical protein
MKSLIESRGQLLALSYTTLEAQVLVSAVTVVAVDGAGRAVSAGGVATPCVRGVPYQPRAGSEQKFVFAQRGEQDEPPQAWEVSADASPLFLDQRGVTFRCEGALYSIERAEPVTDGSTLVKLILFCRRER